MNFYEKCLPVITWNKEHSSEQVVPVTYTLEKSLLTAATFKGFVIRFFSERAKKRVVNFGLFKSSSYL